MNWKNLTIIIPTLNEEESIEKLIKILNKMYKGVNIIVSDDGSKDKTRDIAKRLGAGVVDRSNKEIKGLTISILDAVNVVDTPYFVVMDADLQHPPEAVGRAMLKLKKFDVVGGARRKIIGDWGFFRKLMSKTAIILGKIRLMGRVKFDDLMTGFFGAKTEFFRDVIKGNRNRFELKGYKVFFDLLKLVKRGTPIGCVKYDFNIREAGTSKISKRHILLYLKSLFK
ncbi:glycosyltransferase [Candidatus Woesearchaeota archaeon]|nr:glycosyltransferase [Candidatus Woesearchaeota archaeon]MBL7050838.1 glycosyltransferase [Candidatus Woesearchaeota archaeon]